MDPGKMTVLDLEKFNLTWESLSLSVLLRKYQLACITCIMLPNSGRRGAVMQFSHFQLSQQGQNHARMRL